jgi:hypothetical protein
MCTAVRLDSPAVRFLGVEMNGDPTANDMPGGVDIIRWEDKLTMLALHQSNHLPGDGHDFLVAYSLGKEWREWLVMETDTGTVPPNSQKNIELKFYGIPGASGVGERTAVIRFNTNDSLNPVISWNILLTITSSTRIGRSNNDLRKTFELYQNYPNPFNKETVITFFLRQKGPVELSIFDISGKLVKNLITGNLDEGEHRVSWNGSSKTGEDLSSGFYFFELKMNGMRQAKKMLLLK